MAFQLASPCSFTDSASLRSSLACQRRGGLDDFRPEMEVDWRFGSSSSSSDVSSVVYSSSSEDTLSSWHQKRAQTNSSINSSKERRTKPKQREQESRHLNREQERQRHNNLQCRSKPHAERRRSTYGIRANNDVYCTIVWSSIWCIWLVDWLVPSTPQPTKNILQE